MLDLELIKNAKMLKLMSTVEEMITSTKISKSEFSHSKHFNNFGSLVPVSIFQFSSFTFSKYRSIQKLHKSNLLPNVGLEVVGKSDGLPDGAVGPLLGDEVGAYV